MHFITRPSRMYRNKKYRRVCTRHKYLPNGLCRNCGKVNARKRSRYLNQKEIAQNINEAVSNLQQNIKKTFVKK